jgi:hypothetical protein
MATRDSAAIPIPSEISLGFSTNAMNSEPVANKGNVAGRGAGVTAITSPYHFRK